jgi:hypothetical protein
MRSFGLQIAVLSCIAVAFLALAAPTPAAAAESPSLRVVRRIHVDKPDDGDAKRSEMAQAALKKELPKAGFEVVEKQAAADAVLAVKWDGSIRLDGDEWGDPDYPRPGFFLRLTLVATGEQVWTAEIYLSKGQRAEAEARELAAIAARKLAVAWRKSTQNARNGR